jgi:hypothetical protein
MSRLPRARQAERMTSTTEADQFIGRTALTALLWTALLIAAAVLLVAVPVVISDLASHEDDWDGFGVLLGLMAAVPAVVVAALAGVALRFAGLRRPLAVGLGVLLAVPGMWVPDAPLLLVPVVIGVGLVGVALLVPRPADAR